MAFRFLVTLFLLLAASAAYGNELQITYEDQSPENYVAEGVPIIYTFHTLNVDDGVSQASDGIGTGMQIFVNSELIGANTSVFSSDGCEVDEPPFETSWACGVLWSEGDGEEITFTWTPPGVGTYVMDFHGLCQEWPIPEQARYCDVNDGVPTVAYFETIVSADTDGDGVLDPVDPDDDNDGIPDDLDEQPLVPSNNCTGGDYDNATLGVAVVDDLTCAARVSIEVQWVTEVMGPPAHLRLIAPTIRFQSGFDVLEGGLLSVISVNPCPGCGGYEIGDEGPAGGTVFYVTDGGWHGLEAAPEDQGLARWGCCEPNQWNCSGTVTGAIGVAIGTGAQNTNTILEACGERPIAASLAYDFSLNGTNDWFLPSKDELNLMYENLQEHIPPLGNFDNGDFAWYWSSTESGAELASHHNFGTGVIHYNFKLSGEKVRAIRAF